MNKLFSGIIFMALVSVLPAQTMAMGRVDVGVSIPLPPPIVFAAPPEVVVIPETYVYVVPDVDVDIFFYGGWWWRPWEGRWYRSQNYGSGWAYYQSVPSFYGQIPSGWRNDYRQHRWGGQPWNYQRIPHRQVQQNWNSWERDRHWERQNNWGVQGLRPRERSRQPTPPFEAQHQDKPQIQDQPGHREPGTQPREIQRQQPQPRNQGNPEVREQDRRRESSPQSREVRQPRQQTQQREAQRQSESRPGKQDRDREDKQDRNQRDR